MTYGHLQADCLYTGISSGPNARYRVWEAFTFYLFTYLLTCWCFQLFANYGKIAMKETGGCAKPFQVYHGYTVYHTSRQQLLPSNFVSLIGLFLSCTFRRNVLLLTLDGSSYSAYLRLSSYLWLSGVLSLTLNPVSNPNLPIFKELFSGQSMIYLFPKFRCRLSLVVARWSRSTKLLCTGPG